MHFMIALISTENKKKENKSKMEHNIFQRYITIRTVQNILTPRAINAAYHSGKCHVLVRAIY